MEIKKLLVQMRPAAGSAARNVAKPYECSNEPAVSRKSLLPCNFRTTRKAYAGRTRCRCHGALRLMRANSQLEALDHRQHGTSNLNKIANLAGREIISLRKIRIGRLRAMLGPKRIGLHALNRGRVNESWN